MHDYFYGVQSDQFSFIEKYLNRRMKLKADDVYDVIEI